jgi:hypothetical protein
MVSRRVLLGAAILLAATPAAAHHGWSSYDSSKLVKLAGVVRAIDVGNPHAEMRLEADGRIWLIILSPPSRMEARGLPAASIKVGDRASVEGYVSKSEPDELRAERISHDEKTIELR